MKKIIMFVLFCTCIFVTQAQEKPVITPTPIKESVIDENNNGQNEQLIQNLDNMLVLNTRLNKDRSDLLDYISRIMLETKDEKIKNFCRSILYQYNNKTLQENAR